MIASAHAGQPVPSEAVVEMRHPGVRTLFYCVGAQKAATTWLAEMLALTPDCHVAEGKELHYWTMLAKGLSPRQELAERRRAVRDGIVDLGRAVGRGRRVGRAAEVVSRRLSRLSLARDPSLEAYADRLMRGWRGERVVGEMTPNYATLGDEWLARMAACHSDTRMFLVMRDPVDRLWSGIRHLRTAKADRRPEDDARLLAIFDAALGDANDPHRRRSDYSTTIRALDRVLPPGRVAYFFYDTLMSRGELDRLSGFLGVGQIPLDGRMRVNSGVHPDLDPGPERRARAREVFQPVYDFVAERFGGAVPASWREPASEGA